MDEKRNKILYASVIMCLISLFTGCSAERPGAAINPEDVAEEQFVEFVSPDREVVCQVIGKEGVLSYLQNTNFSEWMQCNEIPASAELQYFIVSYEKVTEDFFLKRGAPEITVGERQLYEDAGDYYIKTISYDNETNYYIPVSAGEYMVKQAQQGSDIVNRNDIFLSWGVKDFEIDSHFYLPDESADVSEEQERKPEGE